MKPNWSMVVCFVTCIAAAVVLHVVGKEQWETVVLGLGMVIHAVGPSLLGSQS